MATQISSSSSSAEAQRSRGFFGRIAEFLREVLFELKKTTYPTGAELMRYTLVVMLFVLVMMGLVTGLDFLFGRGAMFVFGGSSGQ